MSPIAQTDLRLNAEINKAGCLFRSLGMLAELKAGKLLSPEKIMDQYYWLIDHGYMKPNCWVLDHEQVITSAQYYLGVEQGATYLEKQVLDAEAGKGFKRSGQANAYILHYKTENDYGHFTVANYLGTKEWDPYFPFPAHRYDMSFRKYRVGV